MTALPLVLIPLLFLCSVIQGVVGFGFGVFAIPLMLWFGVSLSQAVAVVAVAAFAQTAAAAWQLRKHILWRPLIPAVVVRTVSIPLGIITLQAVERFPPAQVKQIVGVVILVVVLFQMFGRTVPRERVSRGVSLLAFVSSGFLMGFVSMGGPPMVLWVMAHNWTGIQSRAMLTVLYMLTLPILNGLLYVTYGHEIVSSMRYGVSIIPLVIIGVMVGVWAGNHLHKVRLRRAVYTLLLISSISSMLAPLWG